MQAGATADRDKKIDKWLKLRDIEDRLASRSIAERKRAVSERNALGLDQQAMPREMWKLLNDLAAIGDDAVVRRVVPRVDPYYKQWVFWPHGWEPDGRGRRHNIAHRFFAVLLKAKDTTLGAAARTWPTSAQADPRIADQLVPVIELFLDDPALGFLG